MLNTPVLFMTFNRPSTTRRVFEAIKKIQPHRLYLACDGPRAGNAEDDRKCSEVREIISKVDWPCEVKTLFRNENLGCMNACTQAISWFFDHEDKGIILEDDCLPTQSFFNYCEEVLEKYKDDNRVVHVNGNNYNTSKVTPTDYSYHFTYFPQVWGWATWRRAWKKFQTTMPLFKQFDDSQFFRHIGLTDRDYAKIRLRWLKVYKQEVTNVWDYQWHFINMLEGNLVVSPVQNQISNLGFSEGSTHSPHVNLLKADLPRHELSLPIVHPPCLFIDHLMNDNYRHMMINETFMMKVNRKLLGRGIKVKVLNS